MLQRSSKILCTCGYFSALLKKIIQASTEILKKKKKKKKGPVNIGDSF